MDKIESTNGQAIPDFPYIEYFGNYNSLPKPVRQITANEFWHWFSMYGVGSFTETRQVPPELVPATGFSKYFKSFRIFYYHDRAMAIMFPTQWDLKNGKMEYTEDPYFFEIGCDHDWNELSQEVCRGRGIYHGGRCYHVAECKKCGIINSVDSSD